MKKAQAAMDFIITYSWAILSVLAVIGILAYFGVLSPEKYMASECVFLQNEFKCISHKTESGSITLSIQNLKDADVEINSLIFEECKMEQKTPLPSKQIADVAFSGCSIGEKDKKFKEMLVLEYKDLGADFLRSAQLMLDTRIE